MINELQPKTQTFDNERVNPCDESGEQQKAITQLVQQFDPLHDTTSVRFRSEFNISDRHPSVYETIPINCVNNVLKDLTRISLNQDLPE
jgi:hypothetical protein